MAGVLVLFIMAADAQVRIPFLSVFQPSDGTVTIAMDESVNQFVPRKQLGAGVDGLESGEIAKVWTPSNITAMKSAGYGPISYRLRTELGVKAWHWNDRGTWSDPANKQGYWTSNDTVVNDPGVSYGYNLPRRGNSIDQANNDGYSRIVDGDSSTFWKSNPYLDSHFTGLPDASHPQWIMIALPWAKPVQELTINWGTPYATRFTVQRWVGSNDAIHPAAPNARWENFPAHTHTGSGGKQTVTLASAPMDVQFVRILLTADSNTAPPGSTDIRDRLGYAVRELSIGHTEGGAFVDHIVHKPGFGQTRMFVSSTDPWHRATDIDKDYEHASFERTYASGLTSGEPMMIPVPVLYGIPEDAAALVRYLRKRKFSFTQIEMGEEPDGQHATPEDYGALYIQVAKAIKAVDPTIELGGPGYQTVIPDWIHWPDANGDKSWTSRFVKYLKKRGRMDDFDFFSFEWYPFDDVCGDYAKQIAEHPKLLADIIAQQYKNGLPKDVPMVITEYGYSSFAGQAEVELPGAILNAETAAEFLTLGGHTSYFYGLEPNWVFQEEEGKPCNTWGNLMLFQFYDDFKIRPIAAYYSSRLITRHWVQPGTGNHRVFRAAADLFNKDRHPLVTAYATSRPDNKMSVLLFNKDPKRTLSVTLAQRAGGASEDVSEQMTIYQYSNEQWDWEPNNVKGAESRPLRNLPPERDVLRDGSPVSLPPYSITVVHFALDGEPPEALDGVPVDDPDPVRRSFGSRPATARLSRPA